MPPDGPSKPGAMPIPDGLSVVVGAGPLTEWALAQWILRALAARGPVWAVTGWSAARWSARRIAGVAPVDGDQPRWARLHAPAPPEPDDDLRAALASARRIVTFAAQPDGAWAANVARLAPGAARVFIPPRPPAGGSAHVTDWYAAALDASGCSLGTAADWPAPARAGADDAASARDGAIVLHPGSGAQAKCWPADRFAALARALQRDGRAVRVVLGDAERERWRESDIRRWRAEFDVSFTDSLSELAAAIERSSLFVGNDSGPAHLAAELGVPTVALFGPTDATMWRPVGPDVTVLTPGAPAAMTWLSVERAVEAVWAVVDRVAGTGSRRWPVT